jgi:lipopolysaccharide heptosyltransferase II
METMKELKLTGKERILVVRTDRVGDVILSTPVLEAIKSRFPHSHLTILVSAYAAEVVKNNPHLDDVIIDDCDNKHKGIWGMFRLTKEVRSKGFDVSILLKPTLRLASLLFLTGIRYRIGTGYRFYQLFFNSKVYVHRKMNLRHEAEYNLDLLRPLGIQPGEIRPRIYLQAKEELFAQEIWKKFEITGEDTVVVIHPGSGQSSLNLPARRFAQAADRLAEEIGAKVILTGSEEEKGLVDFIKSRMEHQVFDLSGRTSLRQLAAILKRSDLVIANSTGPMHLAAAVGTPTVAVFCPIFSAGPIRWGPYGEGHEVILPPVPVCEKCRPERCPHYDCMEKIKADHIVSKALFLLKRKTGSVDKYQDEAM